MDEQDVEQLLRRYRPADPPASFDERIAQLIAPPGRREPRVWPWAAAPAALLAITLGLHAGTRVAPSESFRSEPGFNEDLSALAAEFGGAPGAHALADAMLTREAIERKRQQESSQSR